MTADTTTLQKAWFTITQLKQLLKKQELRLTEPVAIIGLGCRLPGAANKETYWQLLSSGKNIISHLPEERWELLKNTDEFYQRDKQHAYWGGFLPEITAFDAYFFGISPREALHMDPQQRLLLEVSYEAIEDAGISTEALTGSNTGVFASLYTSQFGFMQTLETDLDALFIPTGNATSIAANRLSYLFDLRGPSLVIDTACSSSLVALHTAVTSLQNSLCDTAIVCAANLNLFPSTNMILSKAKMLSPDGQCKTFDTTANGYVQGEGAGAIILKPLSKALADKDRIYAVISSSGTNQDGKTNGLTAPNGLQQEKLIQSIYTKAQIDPQDISYVECHGTGTFLGDPIEIQALGNVVGKQRAKVKPCWIGSVKTNIGHLEPAAGIASLIKVALALQHSQIPPHLNVQNPNPLLDLEKYNLRIPVQLEEWPKYGDFRRAGISGFGFGGTNAHVLLREISAEETFAPIQDTPTTSEIFTLSAKDPHALAAAVKSWITYLEKHADYSLSQICYNTHIRRSHYFYRIAILATTTQELYDALVAVASNQALCTDKIFTADTKATAVPDADVPKNLADLPLPQLAKLYVSHANIHWPQFEAARQYPFIEMPLYPWQHKSYWPELNSKIASTAKAEISLYPFQGRQLSSPLNTLQFEFKFNAQAIPEIRDTHNILHAGYYLEMLAFATEALHHQVDFTVDELRFTAPVIVPDEKTMTVQLLLEKSTTDDSLHFTFFSSPEDQQAWKEHAKGGLSPNTAPCHQPDSIIKIKQHSQSNQSSDEFYSRVRAMDMPADGSVRWTKQYWLSGNAVLCEMEKPACILNETPYKMQLHFSIIDACIQGLFLALPKHINNPYVASQLGKLSFYGLKGKSLFLYCTLNEMNADESDYRGDWYLINENNDIIAACKDLQMKRLTTSIKLDRLHGKKQQVDYDWEPLSGELRKQKITEYLTEQISHIFSMPHADVDILRSLNDMGMDSLMALVLMRAIESGFGVSYSMQDILQGPSIADITDVICLDIQKQIDSRQNQPAETTIARALDTIETPWITYRQRADRPKMRLFCFPYGGGGASTYRNWSRSLPNEIEICPIQLPGREGRLDELSVRDINALIDELVENLRNEMDVPFAFFGHSFGSLVAFELTRRLRKLNLPLPQHLFISAYPEPSIPTRSLDNLIAELRAIDVNLFDFDSHEKLDKLSDAKLTDIITLFSRNGVTEYGTHAMNAKAIKLLLPIFIADMEIVTSYHYRHEPPLAIPMTVFFGNEDTWVVPADMTGWSQQTCCQCDFHEINSGHMYVRNTEQIQAILLAIDQTLLQPVRGC